MSIFVLQICLPIFFLARSQFSMLDESVICLFFQNAPFATEAPPVRSVRLFLLSRTPSYETKLKIVRFPYTETESLPDITHRKKYDNQTFILSIQCSTNIIVASNSYSLINTKILKNKALPNRTKFGNSIVTLSSSIIHHVKHLCLNF